MRGASADTEAMLDHIFYLAAPQRVTLACRFKRKNTDEARFAEATFRILNAIDWAAEREDLPETLVLQRCIALARAALREPRNQQSEAYWNGWFTAQLRREYRRRAARHQAVRAANADYGPGPEAA